MTGVDRLLQGAGLRRTGRRLLARGEQLLADLLERGAPEALADLGEPVLLLLVHVVRDVLDEHRRLGVEALVVGLHRGQLHDQDVRDVVLLVGLQDVVLEVGEELAHPRVHDLVLDVGVHGEQLDDRVDELALADHAFSPACWKSRKTLRICWWSSLSRTMASLDMGASWACRRRLRPRRTRSPHLHTGPGGPTGRAWHGSPLARRAHEVSSSSPCSARGGGPTNGEVSFWWRQVGPRTPRAPLPGSTDADVCIVGAGYTGLWTAYYLKRGRPDLAVVVLEARFAGFGASGRNGGWLTNSVTGGREQYVRRGDHDAAIAQQRALNAPSPRWSRSPSRGHRRRHRTRRRARGRRNARPARPPAGPAAAEATWPDTDPSCSTPPRRAARVRVAGAVGSLWHPHCASVHPAKLVAGLAAAVERLGVRSTRTRSRRSRGAGRDRARRRPRPLRHPGHRGLHRRGCAASAAPAADELQPRRHRAPGRGGVGRGSAGTAGRPSATSRHAYVYAQRTADDRIAFGGRGVPYRFGSRTDTDGATHPATSPR